MTEEQLFARLVATCQEYGETGPSTYEALRVAIANIEPGPDAGKVDP